MKRVRLVLLAFITVSAVVAIGYFSAVKVAAYINHQKTAEREKINEEKKEALTQGILNKMGSIAVGDTLPDHVFEDLYRTPVRLSDIVREKTNLCFFAPECDYCNDEMETIKLNAPTPEEQEYFIMISPGNPRLIEEIPDLAGLTCPILYDHRAEYNNRLNIFTYPFNIVINEDLIVTDLILEPLSREDIIDIIEGNR
ncbi:MAG: peroxiredoxin family protein [Candidatus Zixiibacteriota bacterium]